MMHVPSMRSTTRASYTDRYAPILPLPQPPSYRQDRHGHYESSDGDGLSSQSESSSSDSEESDSDSDSSSDTSDESDDNEEDEHSSIGERSGSESSLSTYSDQSDISDDGIGILSSTDTFTAMGPPPPRRFWQTDNLGVLALLIPTTGLSTMLMTEVLACYHQFDCSTHYPTLSYAAVFKPAGHAFTIGMCLTAIFIFATDALYHWFLRLRLLHPNIDDRSRFMSHLVIAAGTVTAVSLSGLAIFDMGAYHDTHITFTVVFFIVAWVMMIAVQSTRRRLLKQDESSKYNKPLTMPTCAQLSSVSGIRATLRRLKPTTIASAYQIGQVFLTAGLTATASFGVLFLCVNDVWPNPFGFTAVQEALLEAFAIVCQLLFMGTLSCELSMLTRVVEQHDYKELERAE